LIKRVFDILMRRFVICVALCWRDSHPTLEWLDVRANAIGDPGGVALVSAMSKAGPAWKEISWAGNRLGDATALAWAEFIRRAGAADCALGFSSALVHAVDEAVRALDATAVAALVPSGSSAEWFGMYGDSYE
jgi:hypothetical protein